MPEQLIPASEPFKLVDQSYRVEIVPNKMFRSQQVKGNKWKDLQT